MAHAFSFGFEMLVASIACLLHGFFPFLFEKTGSKVITRLHHRMVTHRDSRIIDHETQVVD
ncbi:MAG: capsule biosynthesis protein [Kordiimonadales bacterium]|nr:MAG: capsule biosynthesis protein [Kordiimonadales bacterium]